MLIWPLRMVGMLLGQLSRAAASAGRIHGVLATEPAIEDHARPARSRPGPGGSSSTASTFGYGRRTGRCSTASTWMFAAVRPSRWSAPPRPGKTTVARLIPRFYDVTEGSVRIDGTDVREAALHDVRRAVGHRLRRHVPLLRHRAQQHRVRRSRGNPRTGRAGGAARRRRRVRTSSARRIRHDRRRARLLALRWSTSAHRDRARGARRPAHPDPRRRNVVGRSEQGARDPHCAARSDARPHDDHHRPPPGDDRARRPRRAARRRHASSPTAPTTGCSRPTRDTAKCSRAPRPTSSPRRSTVKVRRPASEARGREGWRGLVRQRSRRVAVARGSRTRHAPPRSACCGRTAPASSSSSSCCSLQVGTLLAGPALVRYGIDQGLQENDGARAQPCGRAVPRDGVRRPGARPARDPARRPRRRGVPPRAAQAPVRPSDVALARLLRTGEDRQDRRPHDVRHRLRCRS